MHVDHFWNISLNETTNIADLKSTCKCNILIQKIFLLIDLVFLQMSYINYTIVWNLGGY